MPPEAPTTTTVSPSNISPPAAADIEVREPVAPILAPAPVLPALLHFAGDCDNFCYACTKTGVCCVTFSSNTAVLLHRPVETKKKIPYIEEETFHSHMCVTMGGTDCRTLQACRMASCLPTELQDPRNMQTINERLRV